MILAADIGGTKSILGLFRRERGSLNAVRIREFRNEEFASWEAVWRSFLGLADERISAICLGIAGPVLESSVKLTNLPWTIDKARFPLAADRVEIINDMEAMALGALHLPPDDFLLLTDKDAAASKGNIAVIAAGTGLGEALLVWDGTRYIAVPSEGGHTDFAPQGALQRELLQHLEETEGGRVSFERVLSGRGIARLYQFLRDRSGEAEPEWVLERLRSGDPAAAITEIGLADADPVCAKALQLFVDIYGAEAGNLVLKGFARGGVVVGGGIAMKILPALKKGGFAAAFCHKGRMSDFMRSIPIKVMLNKHGPLIGAAYRAADLVR